MAPPPRSMYSDELVYGGSGTLKDLVEKVKPQVGDAGKPGSSYVTKGVPVSVSERDLLQPRAYNQAGRPVGRLQPRQPSFMAGSLAGGRARGLPLSLAVSHSTLPSQGVSGPAQARLFTAGAADAITLFSKSAHSAKKLVIGTPSRSGSGGATPGSAASGGGADSSFGTPTRHLQYEDAENSAELSVLSSASRQQQQQQAHPNQQGPGLMDVKVQLPDGGSRWLEVSITDTAQDIRERVAELTEGKHTWQQLALAFGGSLVSPASVTMEDLGVEHGAVMSVLLMADGSGSGDRSPASPAEGNRRRHRSPSAPPVAMLADGSASSDSPVRRRSSRLAVASGEVLSVGSPLPGLVSPSPASPASTGGAPTPTGSGSGGSGGSGSHGGRKPRLPVLPEGEDYYLEPRLQLLEEMSSQELSQVRDFAVGRKGVGKVQWLSPTDVRGLRVDLLVQLRPREVVVYPDEEQKAALGCQLNKPANITLFDVLPPSDCTEEQRMKFERRIGRKTRKMDATLLDYDSVSGTWQFRCVAVPLHVFVMRVVASSVRFFVFFLFFSFHTYICLPCCLRMLRYAFHFYHVQSGAFFPLRP